MAKSDDDGCGCVGCIVVIVAAIAMLMLAEYVSQNGVKGFAERVWCGQKGCQ